MTGIRNIIKHFYLYNLLGMIILGVFLKPYKMDAHIIEWPISYLLSLYILILLYFHTFSRLKKWYSFLFSWIAFSTLLLFLNGLIEIILTRFFRLEEYYSLASLTTYFNEHLTFWIDGSLWWIFCTVLFLLFRSFLKLEFAEFNSEVLGKKLSQVDLQKLSKEINPHFIFNAMNSIAMKIRMKDNKEAIDMIVSLNDLLRLALRKKENDLITIAEELKLLDQYLLIEKSRFGNHISVSFDCDDSLKKWKVPQLMLQPIVENAFKHGMDSGLENMQLSVTIKEMDDKLTIRVFNSNQGDVKINYASSNVGLPNLVHRLKNHFSNEFQFQSFTEADGIAFKITIPRRL